MASIVKRKKKYSVVYTYTDENGNKRQKWETFETNAEAKKRKLQVEYEQESGTFIPPSAKTVNDLLDEYMSIYPQTPSSGSGGSAESVPPMLEPLASDSAVLGNPMQLNKEIQNKEKQNTDLILSEGEAVRTKVRDNIELDLLCRNQPESAPVMQEIYELVVETIQLRSPVLRLGSNLFPMALVRERLLQLTSEHIRFVLDGLRNLHTDVKNLKKYLLTMLFNAPVTLNGRTMLDVRKSVNSAFRPMLA